MLAEYNVHRNITLTPKDPSLLSSRAFFTSPYAPRPMSPSMTKSAIVRSPRKLSLREGVGGRVEDAELSIELVLSARLNDTGSEGISGGSSGAMEIRPAINETRCCDERRRGRGVVGRVIGDEKDG